MNTACGVDASPSAGKDSLFHLQKIACVLIKRPVSDMLIRGVPVYSAIGGSLTRL